MRYMELTGRRVNFWSLAYHRRFSWPKVVANFINAVQLSHRIQGNHFILIDKVHHGLYANFAVFGAFKLNHRVVLAPLTRNRATKSQKYPRTWYPDELNLEYYVQRATQGSLMISEATPVSIQASGMLGVPGIFTDEQKTGWKKVVDAVHDKGSIFLMQLWHQGRNTHSRMTGMHPISSSAVPITDTQHKCPGMPTVDWEVPKAMTQEDIDMVKREFVDAAKAAKDAGFDGVEIHGANGYLPDQFLHSNINQRTDSYGGTPENRCRFLLELVSDLGKAIGFDRVGVRLAPFCLFNQTRGKDRISQWSYLCSELAALDVAYVHLIEPRFDEVRSEQDKLRELTTVTPSLASSQDAPEFTEDQLTLRPFREALRQTPCIVAGGYKPCNCWEGIERGDHDAIAFGRYFTSNSDLVERLKTGTPFFRFDRSRFYGPFSDNEVGYTVHYNQELAAADEILQTSHGA